MSSERAEGPGRRNGGAGAPGVLGPPQVTGCSDTPLFTARSPQHPPQTANSADVRTPRPMGSRGWRWDSDVQASRCAVCGAVYGQCTCPTDDATEAPEVSRAMEWKAAGRAKMLRLRQQARAEWRALTRTQGPAARRAAAVMTMASECGLDPAWAMQAAWAAFALHATASGAHPMDGNEGFGLRAAADYLEARGAPGAAAFRRKVRGE